MYTRPAPVLSAEEWTRGITICEAADRYSDAAAMGVANAALWPDDPCKITRETIRTLRTAALRLHSSGELADEVDRIADSLESLLPPTRVPPPKGSGAPR